MPGKTDAEPRRSDSGAPRKVPEQRADRRAPAVSLPRGGGALRAIDEKFSINPANGTASLAIALPFSDARSAGPHAALTYNSGGGNGVFGQGWSLDLPSIQRRTDKALPRYRDADDGDVFLLSGAEDLVPAFRALAGGAWARDTIVRPGVTVARYRPRIEGGFARIEKITVAGQPGFFWKITSRENTVTIFGLTTQARIADPADPARIFKWLPELSYDGHGNCIEFVYKAEDLTLAPDSVEEQHRRSGLARVSNAHLKRIRYGNKVPYFADPGAPYTPVAPADPQYFFETVLDYGEHDPATPHPAEATPWPCRTDPFSDHRAGFEIRNNRLCRRLLFFHRFAELSPAAGPVEPYLVRSLDLAYAHFRFGAGPYVRHEADLLTNVQLVHYARNGALYDRKADPATTFDYNPLAWNSTVQEVSPADVVNAPAGVTEGYQFVDLYAEGVSGIITEQANAWFYKRNLGGGHFARAASVVPKPSITGLGTGAVQIQDLGGDGGRQAVLRAPGLAGSFTLDDAGEWQPFRPFRTVPSSGFSDPNGRLLDLNGDGRADLVVTEEQVLRWYPSLGVDGFAGPEQEPKPLDEERGPAVLFADGTETIFVADMTGDGLSDIVRIRNADVCYWPNQGYGKFGAKVRMRDAPRFDTPERFSPAFVRLFDVSGTGATDILYLGAGQVTAWINLAGNALAPGQTIGRFPLAEHPSRISVLDLLGNGTGCLVWSSALPAYQRAPLRYIDLMGGRKPYLLNHIDNGLGGQTWLEYRSSSHYYLRDRAEGRPWVTKLPFPVQCASRHETRDSVTGARYVQEYEYRHGYYDHIEREFRGFAMVEQRDTEEFERFAGSGARNLLDATLHQAPVRTRSWFHTGAFAGADTLARGLEAEYFRNAAQPEYRLPLPAIDSPAALTPEERRQAARACKGVLLRQEVYADDGTPLQALPFSTAEHSCRVRLLQPLLSNRYAVFLTHECESLQHEYERDPGDPRVHHTLNAVIDDLGNVLEAASVSYGRVTADPSLPAETQAAQAAQLATYAVHAFTNDAVDDANHRLRVPSENRSYELTGVAPAAGRFAADEIRAAFHGASLLDYEAPPHPGVAEARLLSVQRTLYARDADPNQKLPLGSLEPLGLQYESYALALTSSLTTALYGARLAAPMLAEAQFRDGDAAVAAGTFPASDPAGLLWIASGTVAYPANPEQHFYLPQRYFDPTGAATTVRYYSDYHLLVDRTEDALGNRTLIEAFDFRFLQPQRSRDINDNITEVAFDIAGRVVGTAVLGKGAEADSLVGFVPDLTDAQVAAFLADPATEGPALLASASSRFVYSFAAAPAVAASITRETHRHTEVATGVPTKIQYAFEYSDGGGRVAMTKLQAEPGRAKRVLPQPDGSYIVVEVDTTPDRRWVGNGRTVLNNKGNPVLRYEPYFSATPAYETAPELVETGVSPVMYYDAPGRVVKTAFPDGSVSRTHHAGWSTASYDRNDTVLASDWYAARVGGGLGPDEQQAAQRAALHDGTPSVAHLDPLGRTVLAIAHNRFRDRTTSAIVDEFYAARTALDVEGLTLAVFDSRGLAVMRYRYDLAGREAVSVSMDAGERRIFNDVLGRPLYGWDAKGNRFHTLYDVLHRPLRHEVLTPTATLHVTERTEYGTNPALNENGKVVRRLDPAGIVTFDAYDFAGNLLQSTRHFARDADVDLDWTNEAAVPLDLRIFTTTQSYDALKRVIETVTPDGSRSRNLYNESNLLSEVNAGLRGGPLQVFIGRIDHDAKGQRQRIDYGNGATSRMTYDPATLRVTRIITTRPSDGVVLQDLRYTYDPVGNVAAIGDAAQQTIYFNNAVVPAGASYTYDAAYRLVAATGREQIALNTPPDPWDGLRTHLPHKADGSALQPYLEQYEYDPAGNMTVMAHGAGTGFFTNRWTRTFTPAPDSNRLLSSSVSGAMDNFIYDPHGNLTSMPHLPVMGWDVDNRLQNVNLGGGGEAWYVYDSEGQRVRKLVRRLGGLTEERLYLGTLEVFRRSRDGAVLLERETLHILDHDYRLALVDTRTDGADEGPAQLIRHQFSNHLGTATLELDGVAAIIGYEEYYPFGCTSFQSAAAGREVPAKRYRYTGKERDEESGLYYHGARYYAPWLARWTTADPLGIKDGTNRYSYSGNRPVGSSDPAGLWEMPSWRMVAVVAAVVVVGVAVTVLTAGVGTAALGAAVGAAGLTGGAATAATVTGTVLVGAASGAAGAWASTATGQVATGTYNAPGAAAERSTALRSGAVAGAATAGVGSALGAIARGGVAGTRAVQTASLATRAARGAAAGTTGGAAYEASRQQFSGERAQRGGFDGGRIAGSAAVGLVLGTATEAVAGPALSRTGNRLFEGGYGAGLNVGSPAGRAAFFNPISRATGLNFVISAPGSPAGATGQPIISLATPRGSEAWYVRSGTGGLAPGGAQPGQWAPFQGFAEQPGFYASPGGSVHKASPGWFVKANSTGGIAETAATFRLGGEAQLGTSQALGGWRIPVSTQEVSFPQLNAQLRAAGVQVRSVPDIPFN